MTSPFVKSLGHLVAAAVVTAASAQAEEVKYERCFGVAKAGQNDCKTSTHICAGKSTADRDPHTYIDLPVGTCAKISGSSADEAPADKK
jgi:uncharacterized membrane protein